MKRHEEIRIEGHVSAGFEAVRDAFAENFSRRHELGGACCVYYRGEKIVDCGVVYETSRPESLGKRTRWS